MILHTYLNEKQIIQISNKLSCEELHTRISDLTKLLPSEFYLTCNGKLLSTNSQLNTCSNVYLNLRILGGKGGFGSMLRAIGAQIEKTTNREACRDLSGRRLRDINEEKRLKAWLDKQKDREAEAKEKKKRKLEKLMAVPKHEFKDAKYENARSELTDKVSEAVEEGFKKALSAGKSTDSSYTCKRKANDNGNVKSKKLALWIGDDISSSSDTDDDTDSDSDTTSEKTGTSSSISTENMVVLKSIESTENESKVTVIETTGSEENSVSTSSTDSLDQKEEIKCSNNDTIEIK